MIMLKEKVFEILEGQLRDNVKAHILQADGSYEKVDKRGKQLYNSQEAFCLEALEEALGDVREFHQRVFIPEKHIEE